MNLLKVAKQLDQTVEMSEGEFRDLLKVMFADVPSYHLNTVVRLVKQGKKKKRLNVLSDRLGGIM